AYPKAGRVRKRIKSMILLAPVTYSKNPGFVGDEDIEEVKKRGEIEVTNHRGFTAKISKKFLDERTHIDTKEIMKPIDINVQIMQGKRDKSIDPRKTEEAYKMLPKGSELVMFPQANHNFQGHKEKIMNKIFEWFEKAGF
ncbi:alpha/beta hydrolase, partial [Candidatus Woesearchaeota archaeon]|nr:alpha/beta hydrolase [Candidatus Woesearchaeota archaeon]